MTNRLYLYAYDTPNQKQEEDYNEEDYLCTDPIGMDEDFSEFDVDEWDD